MTMDHCTPDGVAEGNIAKARIAAPLDSTQILAPFYLAWQEID